MSPASLAKQILDDEHLLYDDNDYSQSDSTSSHMDVALDPPPKITMDAVTSTALNIQVVISAAVAKINYHDIAVLHKSETPETFTLMARPGFHLRKDFYDAMLLKAMTIVKASKPCAHLREKQLQFVFFRPGIAYSVWKNETLAKATIPVPFPADLDGLAPPAIIASPPDVSQSHFFITYDIAVEGPQWVPPPPVVQPAVPIVAPVPKLPDSSREELPGSWPNGSKEFLLAIHSLMDRYYVIPSDLIGKNLAKHFHTYRKMGDPRFKRVEAEMASRIPNVVYLPPLHTSTPTPFWSEEIKSEPVSPKKISTVSASDSGILKDHNTDARRILDQKNEARRLAKSNGYDSDRSRDRDRSHDRQPRGQDRSNSRGPDRQRSDHRRDDEDRNRQPDRNQRNRPAYRPY